MATNLLETKFTVGCKEYENNLRQIIDKKVLDPNFKPNCGCDCAFFPGERIGLKLYREERIRNNAMFHQKLMHGFGLAPEVFEPINVMRKGELKFGYVTELCETNLVIDSVSDEEFLEMECFVEQFMEKEIYWTKDLHAGRVFKAYYNIGRTGRNLAVIDFATTESDRALGELAFSFAS